MQRLHRSIVVGGIFLCVASTVGHGQTTPHASPSPATNASVITAAFPRPLEKSHDERYPLVTYCAAQAERITDSVLWGRRTDTMEWSRWDTLPTEVRHRARTCISQFNLEQLGRLFFGPAIEVSLIAGIDSALSPVFDSIILRLRTNELPLPGEWGGAGNILYALLDAAPARLDLARQTVARDGMLNDSIYRKNPKALEHRVGMFRQLHRFGRDILDVKLMEESRDSVQALQAQRAQLLTRLGQTGKDKTFLSVFGDTMAVWRILEMNRSIKAFRFGSDSIVKNVEEELALLGTVSPSPRSIPFTGLTLLAGPVPTTHAPFTFFRDGITGVPMPGRTMVVIWVGETCEATCAARIMHLKSKIGDVPVVLLAEIFGNVRKSPPGSAAQNAEALRAHFQDSLKVPLSLIVDTVPRYITPDPDLKFLYGKSQLRLNWSGAESRTAQAFGLSPKRLDAALVAVIDKHGRIVWEGGLRRGERTKDDFLLYVIKKIASED